MYMHIQSSPEQYTNPTFTCRVHVARQRVAQLRLDDVPPSHHRGSSFYDDTRPCNTRASHVVCTPQGLDVATCKYIRHVVHCTCLVPVCENFKTICEFSKLPNINFALTITTIINRIQSLHQQQNTHTIGEILIR